MLKIATTAAAAAAALALTGAAALADSRDIDFPLNEEEFLVEVPEAHPGLFAQVDTTGDGQISEEEYHAAIESGLIPDPDA